MSATAAATPRLQAHPATPRRRRTLLAPDILDVVEDAEATATAPAHTLTAAELRAAHDREAAALAGPGPRLASVGDLVIPGPHGWLPMRAYAPVRGPGLPVVAYFHGGGWTVGSIASFDAVARELAAASRALVVSVGCRLAPEHPFPVPVDEAVAAIRWLAANAQMLGGDGSRLAVAGADGSHADASPLRAADLSELPPVFVATAEADVLRDEGEAGAALHAALR